MIRDDPAFLAMIARHHDDLARFARSLTRSEEDARDLVADTVLKAYEAWASLREEGAARTFLFRIAHRTFIRQNIRRKLFGRWDPTVDHPSAEPSPERHTDAVLVRDALSRLPARQRELLVLVDVLGWTLEEVVALHGGTVGGLKATLFRARQRLRRSLTGGSHD